MSVKFKAIFQLTGLSLIDCSSVGSSWSCGVWKKWLDTKGHKVGECSSQTMVRDGAQFSVHFVVKKKKKISGALTLPPEVITSLASPKNALPLCSGPWGCCWFIIRPPHSEDAEVSKVSTTQSPPFSPCFSTVQSNTCTNSFYSSDKTQECSCLCFFFLCFRSN